MSESYLWQLQEDYYAGQSLNAWERVPFYSTSRMNFVGYNAEIVHACLLDHLTILDVREPIYVLELGGGSGCFAYRFLNELVLLNEHFDELKNLQIRYVLSDFTENNIDAHLKNPRLASLVSRGMLDFCVLRPETENALSLRVSKTKIEPGTLKNPLIVIANYLFDTIKHDAFRVTHGVLEEVRFSLRAENPESNLTIQNVVMTESYKRITCPYYGWKNLDSILEFYRDNLPEASVIFPIGAFRSIANLENLSSSKLFLLCSDKGFATLHSRQILGLHPQEFAEHGAFSFDVNFDALKRYFISRGGSALIDSGDHSSLGFMVASSMRTPYASTAHYFRQNVRSRDVCNASYNMEEVIFAGCEAEVEFERPYLTVFRSIVQSSNYDPFIFDGAFARLFERLVPELRKMDREQEEEILYLVRRTAANIFNVANEYTDLAALCEFCINWGHYDECLRIALDAAETLGPTRKAYDFAALACEHLGRKDEAYNYFEKALDLVPDHDWAREGMKRNKVS